ncbi:hypothetical protein [Streptomyces sp. NPDC001876]|uniref:hypothetical protein n=1 Tax=Streptomyces sp. NPDC001876 TaxID=3154402 RepID=UPI00331FE07A
MSFPAGPYCHGSELDSDTAERINDMRYAHCDDRHPSPHWDRTLNLIRDEERCGFNSREALDGWFEGFTKLLAECGFRVYVYDVPDWACRVGEHGQTLFVADEAVEMRTEPFAWTAEQLKLPA